MAFRFELAWRIASGTIHSTMRGPFLASALLIIPLLNFCTYGQEPTRFAFKKSEVVTPSAARTIVYLEKLDSKGHYEHAMQGQCCAMLVFQTDATQVYIGESVEFLNNRINGAAFGLMLGDQVALNNIKAALKKAQEWGRIAKENKVGTFQKVAGTYLTFGGTPINIVFAAYESKTPFWLIKILAADGREIQRISSVSLVNFFYMLDSLDMVATNLRALVNTTTESNAAEQKRKEDLFK